MPDIATWLSLFSYNKICKFHFFLKFPIANIIYRRCKIITGLSLPVQDRFSWSPACFSGMWPGYGRRSRIPLFQAIPPAFWSAGCAGSLSRLICRRSFFCFFLSCWYPSFLVCASVGFFHRSYIKMVKVVCLDSVHRLFQSRGVPLFMEGDILPVLMLYLAGNKWRVLLVYDVPVVLCVSGLQPGDIIEVIPTDEERIKYRI